jgi:hypothetical protein
MSSHVPPSWSDIAAFPLDGSRSSSFAIAAATFSSGARSAILANKSFRSLECDNAPLLFSSAHADLTIGGLKRLVVIAAVEAIPVKIALRRDTASFLGEEFSDKASTPFLARKKQRNNRSIEEYFW